MTHEFKVGDLVKLKGSKATARVLGFAPNDPDLLLVDWIATPAPPYTTYVTITSVTLVSREEPEQGQPQKILT